MNIALFVVTFLLSLAAEASFFISCLSSNLWVDTKLESQPLREREIWSLQMKGLGGTKQNSFGSSSESYLVQMTKLKNRKIIEGPYQVQSRSTQDERPGYTSLSFSIPTSVSPYESGRFTIRSFPKSSIYDPFVMYGWSTAPMTVRSAMYYQCQVKDIL